MYYYNTFVNDFYFLLPELFLTVSICIILCVVVIINTTGKKPSVMNLTTYLAAIAIVVTMIILLVTPYTDAKIFEASYIIDPLSMNFKILICMGTIAFFIVSIEYYKEEHLSHFEYPVIVLISVLGMFGLCSCNDFMLLYLCLELMSLSLYILVSFKVHSEYSTEAGIKYFILGAFSSCLLLFGISIFYFTTNVFNFSDGGKILTLANIGIEYASNVEGFSYLDAIHSLWDKGSILSMILILSGLLFKLAGAPFHAWAPDVYEGSPTLVTMFIATLPKVAILALMIRLLGGLFVGLHEYWQPLLLFTSISSITVGTFFGLGQTKIKRLLAYSAISHVGYILLALSLNTVLGVKAAVIYIFIYTITTIGIFTLLLVLRDTNGKSVYFSDLSLIGLNNPFLAFILSILLFSMSGIPPLAGFFGKYYVFLAAMSEGLFLISIAAIFCSVISSYYYIRLIKHFYFDSLDGMLMS